jgi:hypothetical protein
VIESPSSVDTPSSIGTEGSLPGSEENSNDEHNPRVPSCHYGKISEKIGEACACWLTRWAIDILQIEIEAKNNCGVTSGDTTTQGPGNQLTIWRRGGLTAKWISAIISSDTLFVKNEKERYNLARAIVELRRRDGIIDDEESIWNDMFERGIYYINMVRFLYDPWDQSHRLVPDI